jgi:hypothetical protein
MWQFSIPKDTLKYQVPIAMAIQQSVVSIIKDQHTLVNKCLLHLMYRSMHLLRHLEYMRMVFFSGQGDFISAFHQSVFNNDFQHTALESTLYFLNSKLEQACYDPSHKTTEKIDDSWQIADQGGSQPIAFGVSLANAINDFKFELASDSKMVSNPNFFFTISNVSALS